jgi:hypothetical protein
MILLNNPKIEQDSMEKNSEKFLFDKLSVTEKATALLTFVKNGIENSPCSEVIIFLDSLF